MPPPSTQGGQFHICRGWLHPSDTALEEIIFAIFAILKAKLTRLQGFKNQWRTSKCLRWEAELPGCSHDTFTQQKYELDGWKKIKKQMKLGCPCVHSSATKWSCVKTPILRGDHWKIQFACYKNLVEKKVRKESPTSLFPKFLGLRWVTGASLLSYWNGEK